MSSLVFTVATTDVNVGDDFADGAIRVDWIQDGSVKSSVVLGADGTSTLTDPSNGDWQARATYVDGNGNEFGTPVTSSTVHVGGGGQKSIKVPSTVDLQFNA